MHNKRALITGGTSGIGLETAQQFLADGARVGITGTNPDTLEAAKAELRSDVLAVGPMPATSQARRPSPRRCARVGAGSTSFSSMPASATFAPMEQWDEAGFDRSVAVNLKGPFFLVQTLLPELSREISSSIILTASINARIGMPNSDVYAATKAGLASLARTLSGELIGRDIRVNAVSPARSPRPCMRSSNSSGQHSTGWANPSWAARCRSNEIAQAVVFLASDHGPFTIGSEFVINRGMSNL